MTDFNDSSIYLGALLAERLGLKLPKREGHNLAGPCITCASSDAFRLHVDTGVGHCFSCDGKWSPFQLANAVLHDRASAKTLLVEIGLFQPSANGHTSHSRSSIDPIESIARQKGITADALKAFGAKATSPKKIFLPAYGPDGKPCTTFSMTVIGGKGLFAKGKPAGLFLPLTKGGARLPKSGEVWHLVEGPKDAAALHNLGLLTCGLNTCLLAAKFARLFSGVDIILVPDRDRAGEKGSQFSARVLRGVAKSVRIAVLPAEFKDSAGDDVRDILSRPNGRDQVLQAITDAAPPKGWDLKQSGNAPAAASAVISLPNGQSLTLIVAPASGKIQRLVVAKCGDFEYRDQINTDSSVSRDRFIKKLGEKIDVERLVLAPLIEPQLTKLSSDIDLTACNGASDETEEDQSQATLAATIALEWDLWHTSANEVYATFPVGEHCETWSVRSQTFKRYVAMQFFQRTGKAISSDALSSAINLAEAKALFSGDEHSAEVRVSEYEGKLYLDLCNASWQVVEITANGWRVLDESPVRFRRSRGMLPLPIPDADGTIDQLREFLNVDEDTWRLIVAWLIAALRPKGPYPALALFAEQGSGKSTAGRMLRDLVDPNAAPLRAEPSTGRDLMIAANNSWCLAFDNLSQVPPWLSDALCRLSTGGGFSTRELYSDLDEVIFNSQRPVLLTSIDDVANRSDLLDRSLIVWLSAIPEDRRRAEAEMLVAFERMRPKILGALLNAVSTAMSRLPSTKLNALPRMADFALWATAAETSFGWEPGTFLATYLGNRASANEVAIEASVVARPLLEHMERNGEWSGTASELVTALESHVSETVRRQNAWPKNGRSMSGHLKRLAPNLRAAGWQVIFTRGAKQRLVVIQPADASFAPTSSSSYEACELQIDETRSELFLDDADDGHDETSATSGRPCVPTCEWRHWIEEPLKDGRARTVCEKCGRFIGCRPIKSVLAPNG